MASVRRYDTPQGPAGQTATDRGSVRCLQKTQAEGVQPSSRNSVADSAQCDGRQPCLTCTRRAASCLYTGSAPLPDGTGSLLTDGTGPSLVDGRGLLPDSSRVEDERRILEGHEVENQRDETFWGGDISVFPLEEEREAKNLTTSNLVEDSQGRLGEWTCLAAHLMC